MMGGYVLCRLAVCGLMALGSHRRLPKPVVQAAAGKSRSFPRGNLAGVPRGSRPATVAGGPRPSVRASIAGPPHVLRARLRPATALGRAGAD
jgi:hypothetical protein